MRLLLLSLAVVGISTFNGLACLWLSISVALLNWRPASQPSSSEPPSYLLPLLGVVQLALSAIFFLAHSALVGRGLFTGGIGGQLWWVVAWVPLILTPFVWYALSVVYSGPRAIKRHRLLLLLLGGTTLLILGMALVGGLPSYEQALSYEVDLRLYLGLPQLAWLFVAVLLLCAILPIDALLVGLADPHGRSTARRRARPALIAGSLLLLLGGLLVAGTFMWISRQPTRAFDLIAIMVLDLLICAIIGVAVLVVGSAVVSYEVFTGGALPRRGFLQRWVGTVIVLLASAGVTAMLSYLALRPIYGLLSASAVATAAYALLGWQNDRIRATFMTRLRPFLVGAAQRSAPGTTLDAAWQPLFIALCNDILGTPHACLIRHEASGPRIALRYGWDADLPDAGFVVQQLAPLLSQSSAAPKGGILLDGRAFGATWILPLGGASLEGALLFEGRRIALYSEEEIDLAQACCERLLDALAGAQLTAVALGLLRQRIAEVTVVGARQRRILHDEVLPELHAALIHLGSGRTTDSGLMLQNESAEAITTSLMAAHRQLADLIRAIPPASPHRIDDGGLVAALEQMIRRDFGHAFEHVAWHVEERARILAEHLSPFVAEVIFFAAQEAVRNAARHGRGADGERPLHLAVTLTGNTGFAIRVADDGVGMGAPSANPGSGSGLRFHTAMLAVVGGTLLVSPQPGGGTLLTIEIVPDQHQIMSTDALPAIRA